jgi:hypothetical protein
MLQALFTPGNQEYTMVFRWKGKQRERARGLVNVGLEQDAPRFFFFGVLNKALSSESRFSQEKKKIRW